VVETARGLVRSHALRARRRRVKRPLESCRRVGVGSACWLGPGRPGSVPGTAALYRAAKPSNVSCANEMGEPNGEPMPAGAGPHQATVSHGFRSYIAPQASSSHLQRCCGSAS
jgi:hypothetical protein